MTDILSRIVEASFNGKASLIKTIYDQITDDNLFEFFTIPNLQIRRLLAEKIRGRMNEPGFLDKTIRALGGDPLVREGVLIALSYLPRKNELVKNILQNIEYDSPAVRLAAATAISFQYPEYTPRLLPFLDRDYEMASITCFSENQEMIWPMFEFYNQHPSPLFGFLLNPYWLAKSFRERPEEVSFLINEFGYGNSEVTPELLELLNQGFMFVSEEMTHDPKPEEWQDTILRFMWGLLPPSVGQYNGTTSVDLGDKINVDLFLAAVRASDVENLREKKAKNPFDYRNVESKKVVLCSHAYYRYYKRVLIDDAVKEAERLGVTDQGSFVVDHARVQLVTGLEDHIETHMAMRAKHRAMQRVSNLPKNPIKWPIREDSDYPLAKFGVIREFQLPDADARLSVGANAVRNLGLYNGIELSSTLAELEMLYEKFLVPVGCEIQMPESDHDTVLSWKQALRYLGIPSPRRPEFHNTVEAAFRPAKTYHATILGIMLLHKMGLFTEEQDMAFHISLQGSFGDEVRYIAFPQLFVNRTRRKIKHPEVRHQRMTRLMSKGFCYRNKGVEPCYPGLKADSRTEIRVFCVPLDKFGMNQQEIPGIDI